jgi:hypothetical protein
MAASVVQQSFEMTEDIVRAMEGRGAALEN